MAVHVLNSKSVTANCVTFAEFKMGVHLIVSITSIDSISVEPAWLLNLTPASVAIYAMAKLPYNASLRAWQF